MRVQEPSVENLLWFRKHFPDIYHRLRNRPPDVAQVRLIPAKNEQINLEILHDNNWVPLYSRYNPEQEAERWAQQLRLDADEVILVGAGCGYHLKALLEHYRKIQVHVFEPIEQLLLAGVQGGLFFQLPASRIRSIGLASSVDEQSLFQSVVHFFQPILTRVLDQKVEILFVPSYQRLFEKEVRVITETVRKLASNQRNELQINVGFEKLWTFNALKNLPYILRCPSAGVLKEHIEGKPLIIVSSGPSLEKEVEILKRYREHAVILAAGSSVNGLLHHGVLPHAVISYDPAPPNKKVFDLLATYNVQIPFIFGTTVYHEILSEYQYEKLFHVVISQDTVTPYIFQKLKIKSEPVLSDSPSIAIIALQLAVWWGANPIMLVGQDLAFPNDKFYAAGVSHLRDPNLTEKERENYFPVEKVGGGTVLTSDGLNRMRLNMEAVLKQVTQSAKPPLIINTSSDGARIQGTVEMPLQKAFEQYGSQSLGVDEWFVMKKYSMDDSCENQGLQYLDELFAMQPDLDSVILEMVQVHQQLQNQRKNAQLQTVFHRLDQLIARMRKLTLHQIVYEPMMRVQMNMYGRVVLQVRSLLNSTEKAGRVEKRLQALLEGYAQIRSLLMQHGFIHAQSR